MEIWNSSARYSEMQNAENYEFFKSFLIKISSFSQIKHLKSHNAKDFFCLTMQENIRKSLILQ